MRSFNYYLIERMVKRVSIDMNLAKALVEDAKLRIEVASSINLNEKSSKIIFENSYEALRELADAIMATSGYKSYSHEASISFLASQKILSSLEIEKIDMMRKKRNRMKYYGRKSSVNEAENALKFAKFIFVKVMKILKSG